MLDLDHRARREAADHIVNAHTRAEVSLILQHCHPDVADAIRRTAVWNGLRRPHGPAFHTHRARIV